MTESLKRPLEISPKHSIQQLDEPRFESVIHDLLTVEEAHFEKPLDDAHLLLNHLGLSLRHEVGNSLDTVVYDRYDRETDRLSTEYSFRRGWAQFTGRVALVSLSGGSNFDVYDGRRAHTEQLKPGMAVHMDSDTIFRRGVPLTDEPHRTLLFGLAKNNPPHKIGT